MIDIHSKAILFDLDGTLLDTAPEMYTALNILLTEEKIKTVPFDLMRHEVSNGVKGILSTVYKDKLKPDIRIFNRYLEIYESILGNDVELFEGMNHVIDEIENNDYYWGVVTNKSKRFAIPLIKKLNLFERMDCLVCGDSTEYMKPSPEPLLHALNILNLDKKTAVYYVGDSKKDIDAAKSANFISIACTYGYISNNENPKKWNADIYIDSPMEIINAI